MTAEVDFKELFKTGIVPETKEVKVCHFVVPSEGYPGGPIIPESDILSYPVIKYYHIPDCKCPTPTNDNEFSSLLASLVNLEIEDLDAGETLLLYTATARLVKPSPNDMHNLAVCINDIFTKKMVGVKLIIQNKKLTVSDTYFRVGKIKSTTLGV